MRSSRFNLALLLLACLAASVHCAAQQRISGTVTDKRTHTPLKAISLKLEGDVLPAALETTTDADGRFSFAGLSPARYTVRVSADAFYAQAMTLTLAPREARQVDFEMTPLAGINERVTVRARPRLLDETEAATVSAARAVDRRHHALRFERRRRPRQPRPPARQRAFAEHLRQRRLLLRQPAPALHAGAVG
ncbi:MAG: hypothetical protein DMF66_20215 [Acidobacteria bacterium]|nr:MAG: hypothetical protein DMF66_20215 [Acidobacteriota bacterium]